MALRAESSADVTRLAVGFARAMMVGLRSAVAFEHPLNRDLSASIMAR